MLSKLLGAPPATPPDIASITHLINNYVMYVSYAIMSVCGLGITLFAIYVGFKFFKAEDDKARTDAKQQLIYSIIGLVAVAVVYTMILAIIPQFTVNPKAGSLPNGVDVNIPSSVNDKVYAAVAQVVNAILSLIMNVAVVFCVYIGWKFMSAEDDKKRKDAKMQLIYVFIGVVAVIFINVVAQAVIDGIKPTAVNNDLL